MAFRKKFHEVITDDIDLAIIQECENEERLQEELSAIDYNEIIWYGNNVHKGIGIISFNEVHIALKKSFNSKFEYVLPITLSVGKREINLFAIWAMPHKESKARSYVGQVWAAINFYEELLNQETILVGDLNSNKFWDKRGR